MASKQSVYYQRILDAEEESNRFNHKLEREWQRLENRLAVTQVRLERARDIRDEYLDYLQKKYPQWRSGIRRSKDLYYDDEMRSETGRNLLTSSISGLSASSNSILDRLATRKYWSDIGSAELVHQVETRNVRKDTQESAALKSDIDWIKKRLNSITSELNDSKTRPPFRSNSTSQPAIQETSRNFGQNSAEISSPHQFSRKSIGSVRFEDEGTPPPLPNPTPNNQTDETPTLAYSESGLAPYYAVKNEEPPPIASPPYHPPSAAALNRGHTLEDTQAMDGKLVREANHGNPGLQPSKEILYPQENPTPDKTEAPKPNRPRINFGITQAPQQPPPVSKNDDDVSKYNAFHTSLKKSEPESESNVPDNPLEMLPTAAPYRPLTTSYAAPSAGYESLLGISRSRAPVNSDSESDSLEERINRAVSAKNNQEQKQNPNTNDRKPSISDQPATTTEKNGGSGDPPPKSPAGKELMAKFFPGQAEEKPKSSLKTSYKMPSYLRKPGDSDSDSDVVIPKKTESDDDDDFFG